VTIENCTLNGYDGFLYANKSTPTVVVKNVTMNGGIYGMHWVYGTTATLENVTMTNVTNGLLIQNYAAKTINLKNCDITSIAIWERSGYSGVQTFNFEGKNTVDTLSTSQYAKYVLAEATATLTALEGHKVTTDIADHKVVYVDGVYKVAPKDYVAQIGEKKFESLVEAFKAAEDGDIITMIADHVMDGSKAVNDTTWIYDNLIVSGEAITLDFAGYTVEVTPNFTATNDGGLTNTLESIIFIEKGGSLTLKDSTGKGGFYVKKGTDLYSMIYNSGSTLVIESGNYYVEETIIKGSVIYADEAHKTTINGGVFTLVNAGADASTTKPWIFNAEGKNVSFAHITGGYFNDNPQKNLGTTKDCEVTIPDGKLFKQLTEGEYAGYWVLVDAVAQNTNTGVYYATVNDALAAAEAEETVIMLKDSTGDYTMVSADVTLDLNGFTYITTYMVVFNDGHIVDNSTSNAGRLAVDSNKLMINDENAQLPVKTADGYMFVEVIKFNEKWKGVGYYVAQPFIEDTALETLKADYQAAGISIVFRISWINAEGDERVQDFVFGDNLTVPFFNSYDAETGKYGKQFSLTLNGLDSDAGFTYETVVISDTGVEFSSNGITS